RLGARISYRRLRVRPPRGSGGNRDDVAGSALLHPWQETLDGEKGRREVSLDGGAPVLFAHRLQRTWSAEAAASIRDEDVERTELFLRLRPHRFDLGEARQLCGHGDDSSTGAFDLRANRGHCLAAAPVHHDPGALLRE